MYEVGKCYVALAIFIQEAVKCLLRVIPPTDKRRTCENVPDQFYNMIASDDVIPARGATSGLPGKSLENRVRIQLYVTYVNIVDRLCKTTQDDISLVYRIAIMLVEMSLCRSDDSREAIYSRHLAKTTTGLNATQIRDRFISLSAIFNWSTLQQRTPSFRPNQEHLDEITAAFRAVEDEISGLYERDRERRQQIFAIEQQRTEFFRMLDKEACRRRASFEHEMVARRISYMEATEREIRTIRQNNNDSDDTLAFSYRTVTGQAATPYRS